MEALRRELPVRERHGFMGSVAVSLMQVLGSLVILALLSVARGSGLPGNRVPASAESGGDGGALDAQGPR